MTDHVLVRRAALIFGAALLGAYFLLASISQMPLNPIKLKFYDPVNAITQPYLAQNWMLFAPNPLSDDRGILARAKCSDGRVTDFYNVTRPYVEREQGDRFFPSRTNRLVSGTISQLDTGDPILERLRSSEKEKKKPVMPLLPQEKTSRSDAENFLARFSLKQLSGVCTGGPAEVQVRVYVHELPPWSERKIPSATGKTNVQDLEWKEAETLG
ncbi:hypothetical protein KVH02_34625 [Streptomyces olivaceus]|uniref:Uncharacterized protein n=1 Tax=Streptomyces olivaceus TaxID=47716 RepID=A0ABS7WGA3_STROV|nr:DUF5819 family protein [Streptomyces olivaceus]MBZ6093402.1 hypothetical protein [Streptomyces olivaceus]MBZ6100571.1 hypothetical protein [Streptomyces olivaceus]MBZ6121672.1 hypothetical protein [Streptomyces olivaceus]MBZ6156235.1 hypothetical protein [Streptomyces olivaceus]MBZ6302887.1 hypothetical protein [Streptomyces olivaceus]